MKLKAVSNIEYEFTKIKSTVELRVTLRKGYKLRVVLNSEEIIEK